MPWWWGQCKGNSMSQTDAGSPLPDGRALERVKGYDSLVELALDMRWSWNHGTDNVWWQLDAKLWEATHNP